jgi:hypothetical protein
MKILINEQQLNFLVEQTKEEEKIYNRPGDPYEYKHENNTWFARKKGSDKWLDITKYQKSIDILNKEFPQKGKEGQEQKPEATESKVNKNDLDSIINAVTDNANVAKFMKQQTNMEGSWKSGTLNFDQNNPGNMLPDASSKRIDPNLTVTNRSKYAKFSTPELGFKAYLSKVLRWAKGGMPAYGASTKMIVDPKYNKGAKHTPYKQGQVPTLAQFIYQWAPPTENDTEAYINFILKAFPGSTSETPMTELLGV